MTLSPQLQDLAPSSSSSNGSDEPTGDSGVVSRPESGGFSRFLPREGHLRLLWVLVLVVYFTRIVWIDRPNGSLIFDEKYYVNAVRVILSIPPGQETYVDRPLGRDPNTEHPPLAKLIVAASMRLLGDNAYGWRIPSVFFGTASIVLMYLAARRLTGRPYLSVLAATLLAFDNLVFVHSRIFTLDIFMLTFMLLGLYWYSSGRAALAGVGFALAALCKVSGVFGVFAMFAYEGLRMVGRGRLDTGRLRPALRRLARLTAAFVAVFLVLLGIMDRLWVGYAHPFEHLRRISTYGMALRREVPRGIESYPWQWLWNDKQIPYIKVDQRVSTDDENEERRPIVLFLGAMNPYVLQLWPLGLAAAGYLWWRRRPEARASAMALAWFAACFLPFCAATIFGQRISYLFYFLPTLPAIALAGSIFLTSPGLPRVVVWAYLAAVLLTFYGYFPFKQAP